MEQLNNPKNSDAERAAEVFLDPLPLIERERSRLLPSFDDLEVVDSLDDKVARGVHVGMGGASFGRLQHTPAESAEIP